MFCFKHSKLNLTAKAKAYLDSNTFAALGHFDVRKEEAGFKSPGGIKRLALSLLWLDFVGRPVRDSRQSKNPESTLWSETVKVLAIEVRLGAREVQEHGNTDKSGPISGQSVRSTESNLGTGLLAYCVGARSLNRVALYRAHDLRVPQSALRDRFRTRTLGSLDVSATPVPATPLAEWTRLTRSRDLTSQPRRRGNVSPGCGLDDGIHGPCATCEGGLSGRTDPESAQHSLPRTAMIMRRGRVGGRGENPADPLRPPLGPLRGAAMRCAE
ncbi:hypothetical protein DFH08DRAFT_815908 [Mycena albidolilacea]|uniref:Uncharacterized protein n=1 Tax=Mycena albidolilacea TaxID=1033008 RepID=A0AAD6ZLQ7_9AGAR|nr:hypothetical protein DFH08DRAFT_815908 [Mycena albidolilacea]